MSLRWFTLTLTLTLLATSLSTVQSADEEMKLFLLRDGISICNDGSPAGFWLRRGEDPTRWVIYLQGGGYCFSNISCESRWTSSKSLMSSTTWSSTQEATGILSADPVVNRYWFNATAVWIGYCSSDSFSGDKKASGSTGTDKWNFVGSRIVENIIQDLKKNYGLDRAKDVVFTGSSAGAEGLLANSDRVANLLDYTDFKVLIDSGWFLDFAPFKAGDCDSLFQCTESRAMQLGCMIWNPRVNEACALAKPQDLRYQCMLGPHAYPYIKSPAFILQFQFDAAQMAHDGIDGVPTGPALIYAQQALKNLTRTFEEDRVRGYYNPSCYQHTIIQAHNWNTLKIDGKTLPDVFYAWTKDRVGVYHFADICDLPNCNPTCR